jgi:hypothetical protein
MANKHLKTSPHSIGRRDDCWWYEEPAGVCVVIETYDGRGGPVTKQLTIPWPALKAALSRKEK